MKVVYARQAFPEQLTQSIFLAGPCPRETGVASWRPEFLVELEKQGYQGTVFTPESDPTQPARFDYDNQVEWEQHGRQMADAIVFWVPRKSPEMPAFTTNIEFGEDLASGRIVYGRPTWAEKCRYLDKLWAQHNRKPLEDISSLVTETLRVIGKGSNRTGGECRVPLNIWKTKQFQTWYASHKSVGNRLDDVKTLWNFRVGPNKDIVFSFALWVKVWITKEQRFKENEFIVSRTDIATIVPFWKGKTPEQTKIVLVREFRSPVRNNDGFVHELPGGSSPKPEEDPLEIASHELEEETGISIDATRFQSLGSRQMLATLSTHHAQAFKVVLTDEEIKDAERVAASGKYFGLAKDSERTYLEVKTVQDILDERLVDWSMLGIIFQAIMET